MSHAFQMEPSWQKILGGELSAPYMHALKAFLDEEVAKGYPIYPPLPLLFHAFEKTPFDEVRVVILGQDPYHGAGQAHGLCFSVPAGVSPPPSLKNIFKELKSDLGIDPVHGCLESWAAQGVLLLNTTLSVRDAEPLSHHKRGWERFTDAVVAKLAERKEPMVFILWGNSAQKKCENALKGHEKHHCILKAPHPSPLSAYHGFFGSRPFSKANAFLKQHGLAPIDWATFF